MQTVLDGVNVARLASEVAELLGELQGHLDASMSPDRLALQSLGVDPRLGWTKLAYCDDAFDRWTKLLKRKGNDHLTLHHLAIMHHARAQDIEQGKKPAESDADWEAAMLYWQRLHEHDGFWDHLVEMACKGTKRDAVDELRRQFPVLLLQLHYDIAFDKDTRDRRKHRAKYHIGLAQGAPFAEEDREMARRRAYDRFIRTIPAAVWQHSELSPEVIKQGTDCIEEYLKYDPGCIPALEDALRLQSRLLRARNSELQAIVGDPSARGRILNALKKDADYWRDYFDQLVGMPNLEDEIRQKLGLWYRVMGQVLRALDKHEEAISLYEKGVEACRDDDEGRRCRSELGDTMAYVAREKVHNKQSGAKQYCANVARRKDLSVSAIFLLANAYTLLEEFDIAEKLCDRGLAIKPEITDYSAMQEHEKDRERLTQMHESIGVARKKHHVHSFLEEAQKHLKTGAHEKALDPLNSAIEADPTEAAAYFLRAQALLGLQRPSEAKNDLATIRKLAGKAPESANLLKLVAELENTANQMDSMVKEFGGAEALALRQQAVQAANAERHEEAIGLLRQALEASIRGGVLGGATKIKKELSMVLTNAAVEKANQAQRDLM